VTVAAGVRPFGRRRHGYRVARRVENDNDDDDDDVRCTHVFSRCRTTTATRFSPRQPSTVRGDDAGPHRGGGSLKRRGGYPRPPVKYNRRRRSPPRAVYAFRPVTVTRPGRIYTYIYLRKYMPLRRVLLYIRSRAGGPYRNAVTYI